MKVCLVYKEEYPWDVRVEKIATTLADHGHEVTIVARNNRADSATDSSGKLRIVRLPSLRRLPVFMRKLANFAVFFNPLWIFAIAKGSTTASNSVLIVRDLPLAFAAIAVAKFRGIPVVLDMAECYPEMYASMRQFDPGNGVSRLVRSERLASIYERSACKFVDHILVMIEESFDRLIRIGITGVPATIVSNTPRLPTIRSSTRTHEGTSLRIIYVGFVTRLRGLDLLIKAGKRFQQLTGDERGIQIDIVGVGPAMDELRRLIIESGMEPHVTLHGRLDQSQVDVMFRRANVGALPYRVCGHWNHTIPNKLFDYMLAELPVLATNVRPIARILSSTKAGVVSTAEEPDAIASAMIALRDPASRQSLGSNGRQAIIDKYNWNLDGERMIDVLRQVSRSKHTANLPDGLNS